MTNIAENINQLDQKNIGNHVLDAQEIAYLRSKNELFVNDIAGLADDIQEKNKESFQKDAKCRYLLDSYVNDPKLLTDQLHVSATVLVNALKNAHDPFEKRVLILKMLFNSWKGRKDGIDINTNFSYSLIKEIHRFQKQHEHVAGWSKADCIVGYRTIQQLLSELGVNAAIDRTVDTKFASSRATALETYRFAAQSFAQIDAVMLDKSLSAGARADELLMVYTKTVPEKQSGITNYLTYQLQLLYANASAEGKAQIMSTISQKNITALSSFLTLDAISAQEKAKQKYEQRVTMIENLVGDPDKNIGWLGYYKKEAPKGYELVKNRIGAGLKTLHALHVGSRTWPIASSTEEMKKALDNIFFSTEINKFPVSIDKKIDTNVNPSTEAKNHNAQIDLFAQMKQLLLDENADPLKTRQIILTNIRYIDDKLDNIGMFDTYNSGEALTGEMHAHDQMQQGGTEQGGQDISAWKIDNQNNKDALDYNANMQKVHDFFNILTQGTEAQKKEKLSQLTEFRAVLSKFMLDHRTQSIPNDERNPQVQAAFDKLGMGVRMTGRMMKALDIQMKEASEKVMPEKLIPQVRDGFVQSRDQIDAKIAFYTSEAQYDPQYSAVVDLLTKTRASLDGAIKGEKISGMSPELDGKDIRDLAREQSDTTINMIFAQGIEKLSVQSIMEQHTNALVKNGKGTAQEKMIDLYADIKGYNGHMSDEIYNTMIEITKEIIIQVVVCVVSMGVANLAMNSLRGMMIAGKLGSYAIRLGKYMEMAEGPFVTLLKSGSKLQKAGFSTARVALTKGGTLALEGTVFHVSSTVMGNVLHAQEWTTGLDEGRGYIQSIAFLGVLKEVSTYMNGKLLNGKLTAEQETIVAKLTKGEPLKFEEIQKLPSKLPQGVNYTEQQLKTLSNSKIDLSVIKKMTLKGKDLKQLAKSFGVEMGSMMITEQIISLTFDQSLKEYSAKDMATMIGMILGLRGVHMLGKNINVKSLKKDAAGNVVDVVVEKNGVDISLKEISKKYKEKFDEFMGTEQGKNRRTWTVERFDQEIQQRKDQIETNKKLISNESERNKINDAIQKDIDVLEKQKALRQEMGDARNEYIKEKAKKTKETSLTLDAQETQRKELSQKYKDKFAEFKTTELWRSRVKWDDARYNAEIIQREDQMKLNSGNSYLSEAQKTDINGKIQKDIDVLKQQKALRGEMEEIRKQYNALRDKQVTDVLVATPKTPREFIQGLKKIVVLVTNTFGKVAEWKTKLTTYINNYKTTNAQKKFTREMQEAVDNAEKALTTAEKIDGQYNNYSDYSSIEQKDLQDHLRWQESQSLYEKDLADAQTLLNNPLYKDRLTNAMKAVAESSTLHDLSTNEISTLQREIGMYGKDIDGILGPKTLGKMKEFLAKEPAKVDATAGKEFDKAAQDIVDNIFGAKPKTEIDVQAALKKVGNFLIQPYRWTADILKSIRKSIRAYVDAYVQNITTAANGVRQQSVRNELTATTDAMMKQVEATIVELEKNPKQYYGKEETRGAEHQQARARNREVQAPKEDIFTDANMDTWLQKGNKVTILDATTGKMEKYQKVGFKNGRLLFAQVNGVGVKEYGSFIEMLRDVNAGKLNLGLSGQKNIERRKQSLETLAQKEAERRQAEGDNVLNNIPDKDDETSVVNSNPENIVDPDLDGVIEYIESQTPEHLAEVNNFTPVQIEDLVHVKIGPEQMARIKKVHDMDFKGQLGRDGLLPPGILIDTNGNLQSNFTKRQLVEKRAELMKDGMFTKEVANALLKAYVCGNTIAAELVANTLAQKVINVFQSINPHMTPVEISSKLGVLINIFDKAQRYSLNEDILEKYGLDATFSVGGGGNAAIQIIDQLFTVNKIATAGKAFLYRVQDMIKMRQEGFDQNAVRENALLSDGKRSDKGLQIIKSYGITLSSYDEQILRDAMVQSHEIGLKQPGKDGNTAEIYNYTNKQLWQKMQILYKAVAKINEINRREVLPADKARLAIKELLRKGICGSVEIDAVNNIPSATNNKIFVESVSIKNEKYSNGQTLITRDSQGNLGEYEVVSYDEGTGTYVLKGVGTSYNYQTETKDLTTIMGVKAEKYEGGDVVSVRNADGSITKGYTIVEYNPQDNTYKINVDQGGYSYGGTVSASAIIARVGSEK